MKNLIKYSPKYTLLVLLLAVTNAIAWAQDSTVMQSSSSTTTTSEQTTWYTAPWVWVVGGAVLLLVIVALVRGNSGNKNESTERVTVTKTRSTD